LHTKNAIPLFILGKNRCFKKFINSYCRKLKLYDSNEFTDNTWIKIEKPVVQTDEVKQDITKDDSFMKNSNTKLNLDTKIEKVFTPKFRVVIKKDR
jgi:hypothetical protein